MDKITYSIVSKGELIINFRDKPIRITGELTCNPQIFYADLIALEKVIKGETVKYLLSVFEVVEFLKRLN